MSPAFLSANMEDHHTTDFSWNLATAPNGWPSSWPLETPTHTLFAQDTQTNTAPEISADRVGTVGNGLSVDQFLDKYRREIEKLNFVKGMCEETNRIRRDIELLIPRLDHVEANSYTLQQGATGCSCGQGLVLVDLISSTMDQMRQDMLRVNEFKVLVDGAAKMEDGIKEMKAIYGQIKTIMDLLESRVDTIESQVSDFAEFAADTNEWMAEMHEEVTAGKGRRRKPAAAGQEEQTENK